MSAALSQIMKQFRAIKDGGGHTLESLRDHLNETHLAHDPVCTTTVHRWLKGVAPRGARLLGLIEFVKQNQCQSDRKHKTSKPKRK